MTELWANDRGPKNFGLMGSYIWIPYSKCVQGAPEIPFMASLWIRSGYDMKVEMSADTYQVGAHFKAFIKAILVAPSRNLEKFFSFRVSLPRCVITLKLGV